MGRTEKLCNYFLASAKITMTGVKRRLLSARRSFVCSRETNFLLVSVNIGRAAIKLGEERLYWHRPLDIIGVMRKGSERIRASQFVICSVYACAGARIKVCIDATRLPIVRQYRVATMMHVRQLGASSVFRASFARRTFPILRAKLF